MIEAAGTAKAHPVAYQLQLHPAQVPPDTLLPIWNKTEDEFLGDQLPYQPICILDVMLASSRSTVGKRSRQMKAPERF